MISDRFYGKLKKTFLQRAPNILLLKGHCIATRPNWFATLLALHDTGQLHTMWRYSDLIAVVYLIWSTAYHKVLLDGLLPGPKVIKLFSCSTQLSLKFVLLVDFKIPTVNGIIGFRSSEPVIYSAN